MSASDAPQRAPGLRTRSGNAMLRTRTAILDAAAATVAASGVRRTTMSEIAASGGVAKATLYNHFRTKDDVLAALVEAQVAALATVCEPVAASGLARALEQAAAELAALPALRRVAADEPALLAPLLALSEGRTAEQARAGVAAVLSAAGATAGAAEVELVLRWLAGQLLAPLEAAAAAAQAALLVSAVSPAGASAVPEQGRPEARAQAATSTAGLGWPGRPDRLRTN